MAKGIETAPGHTQGKLGKAKGILRERGSGKETQNSFNAFFLERLCGLESGKRTFEKPFFRFNSFSLNLVGFFALLKCALRPLLQQIQTSKNLFRNNIFASDCNIFGFRRHSTPFLV